MKSGHIQTDKAKEIDVHKSTISQELKRNAYLKRHYLKVKLSEIETNSNK